MGPPRRSNPEVVLITPYHHPIVGGVTTYVAGLATELARRGAKVTVLTREGSEAPGVVRGPTNPRAFVRWCRRAIRSIRPDVIHGHGHWYCLAGAFSLLGHPLAPRVLFTVHTVPDVPRRFRVPFRRLLRRAHVITFVSDSSRNEFVGRFGSPSRSAVVFPGVRNLSGSAVRTRRVDTTDFRICAISIMSWAGKVEGLRMLLQATAQLSRVVPGVSLTLVGDGEFRPDLEALSQGLGIGDRVEFPGLVDDPGEILSESDVLCHISFMDSFPQAVIEAMSVSLPVVVNEGSLDSTIFRGPEQGIVRCRPTVEGAVEALHQLASNPEERRCLGTRGREFVVREFSWVRQGARFWELYGLDSRPQVRDER